MSAKIYQLSDGVEGLFIKNERFNGFTGDGSLC